MSDELCTYGTPLNGEISEVIAASDKFDCSDDKYHFTGSKLWIKFPFRGDAIPPGAIEVQGDNNGLSSMAVHSLLSDGTVESAYYSEQEVIDSWRPKGLYGLQIPGSEDALKRSRIETVYISLDNPRVASSITLMQLKSKKLWDDLKLPLSTMFALLCGMAIMPFFYNAFFYGALRHSFMLWHSVMIIGTVVYTFSSSGLIFLVFPETSLTTKFLLNYWTLAIAIAASGFFLDRFVEQGKIAKWLRSILLMAAVLPVFTTAFIFQSIDGYDANIRNYYHASFVPYLIIVLYTMVHALRRGSRAIWFQIAAWTPIIVLSFDRIARGMDLYIGIHELDYGLYFALVLETIVLAFGVANRIMQLRRKHENTLRKQVELTLLAETDGLTAIGNRRAFEKAYQANLHQRRYNHLAILDIDFFKRVNDLYGHEVGDDVLRIVGKELAATRHFVARIGGEEFALLLKIDGRENRKENPASELTKICETLIKAVHNQVPVIKQPVTFSVGVAAISKRTGLRTVMSVADKRLYNAKNNGRNQVVSFDISNLKTKPGADSAIA
ncbi:sensor domain-containing diguanylate cyclase [Parasphingorhabdus cellanae]|uniref:diguanylate cyclase n=1 Tax=Parasphingorhabdus cellanae TaxID=2806553 RepID=A0ABX7T6C4_9SPHN|nr:diguanylate cyclase [Parasphingorhabdus cellanae]QTD57145.1 diguanylate cyclase [Parasphingorhabdus cellanae]